MNAAKFAVIYFPRSSDLAEQAGSFILEHLDALDFLMEKIEAARTVAKHIQTGLLKQQAEDKLCALERSPTPPAPTGADVRKFLSTFHL